MNTFLKYFIYILLLVAIGVFLFSYFQKDVAKPLSPKKTETLALNDLHIEVNYGSPSKRNREIFGALVPYNKVWRTGANEATTFYTNKNLHIKNQKLPEGSYTLWTIPSDTAWQVIFNSKQYPWGVDAEMNPMRLPEFDVVNINIPIKKIDSTVEAFTIHLIKLTDSLQLNMLWDKIKIEVPFTTF